jgi:hypothetical protein
MCYQDLHALGNERVTCRRARSVVSQQPVGLVALVRDRTETGKTGKSLSGFQERAVAACRWLLAAVAGVLAAQHIALVMNIARLTAYLAGGLLVAILLQSLALWLFG